MGRVKKEQAEMETLDVQIDDSYQEPPMVMMPKTEPKEAREERTVQAEVHSDGLVNCLRNERVRLQFIPSPNAMVRDPKHVLSGGMADTSTRSFVVPRLSSTGLFKNVLTKSEKEFLEYAMGLEYNALSIYKKTDNFWDDSNPNGIGKVTLHKDGDTFDLSTPEGYIKYKILLANSEKIAASLKDLEEHPKATYQFVIVSENAEAANNLSKMDATRKCYMEFGKVESDADTLRTIVEIFEGRPIASSTKLDYLQGKINEYIQKDARRFLSIITDELLPAKVLIRRSVEAGLIGKKNDTYYLREDGSPLCEMNEESTLNTAAKYISSVKRQELKYSLEAKLKTA